MKEISYPLQSSLPSFLSHGLGFYLYCTLDDTACSSKYILIIHFMILVVNILFRSKKKTLSHEDSVFLLKIILLLSAVYTSATWG